MRFKKFKGRPQVIALMLLTPYLFLQWTFLQAAGPTRTTTGGEPSHGAPFGDVPLDKIDLKEEVEKGLSYVRSINDTKRKLVFVHIPKTAGTTIEEVGGRQAKIAWGSCLFNHRPKRPGNVCHYPPGQFEWPTKIGYWHLPTQLFPLKGLNPYEGADLFAVMRDPYERLISEFYYICRRKITKFWDFVDCNRTRLQEPEYMNEWIRNKLEEFPIGDRYTPKDFLNYNGHYTPQSQFLVSYPAEIRMVDYVLRMDNLVSEFNSLMKVYDISVVMLPEKLNAARNASSDLSARHFDTKTIEYLHEMFADEIDLLHAKMMDD